MEPNKLEVTTFEEGIVNGCLVNGKYFKASDSEKTYLESMMPTPRQEGYTCVTGCKECVSCGGND